MRGTPDPTPDILPDNQQRRKEESPRTQRKTAFPLLQDLDATYQPLQTDRLLFDIQRARHFQAADRALNGHMGK